MVEGHQCHRVAAAHRRLLVGKRFQARSPNGRFTEGAKAVDGKVLSRIEVIGKNMFYFFGGSHPVPHIDGTPVAPLTYTNTSEEAQPHTAAPTAPAAAPVTTRAAGQQASTRGRGACQQPKQEEQEEGMGEGGPWVIRIHFGMSGAFKVSTTPQGLSATSTTRLSLTNSDLGLVAMLSAMTVELGGQALFKEWEARLGPDPLREDADSERLWLAMRKSKKPVGLVLMTQEMIAGLGNIYRAEVLFKAGVHPEQPAHSVSRRAFEALWFHSVSLLQRGFSTGSILTVDPEEARVLGKPWTRRYIYNQRQCGRCKGVVRSWDMAARTVYCCDNCQPLLLTSDAANGQEAEDKKSLVTPPPKRANADGASTSAAAPAPRRKRKAAASQAEAAGGAAAAADDEEDPEPTSSSSKDGDDNDEGGGNQNEKKGGLPASAAALLTPARLAAMQAATPARVFQSHCAPDDEDDMKAKMAQAGPCAQGQAGTPSNEASGKRSRSRSRVQAVDSTLTVAQLKELLKACGLATTGTKPTLLSRLAAADATPTAERSPSTQTDSPGAAPHPVSSEAAAAPAAAGAAGAGEAAAGGKADVKPAQQQQQNTAAPSKSRAAAAAATRLAAQSGTVASSTPSQHATQDSAPNNSAAQKSAGKTAGRGSRGETGAGVHVQGKRGRGYRAGMQADTAVVVSGEEDEVDHAERLLADQLGVPCEDAVIHTGQNSKEDDGRQSRKADDSRQNKKQRGAKDTQDTQQLPAVAPGTRDLPMASPEEAAREKAAAGENRAVEHVPF